jgi:hypothetical protein
MKNFASIIKLFWLIAAILLLMVPACEERSETELPEEFSDRFIETEYNSDLSNLSIALSSLLSESKDLRTCIKENALIQFDGDYDIILSSFLDEEVTLDMPDLTKGYITDGKASLRNLLNEKLNKITGSSVTKGEISIIDEMTEKYPYLQVSVPVNAEDWDEETYIPDVTFIPEEYDEATTEYVIGYNSDGEEVLIDAVNPPEDPVIVLSMNERIDLPENPKAPGTPATPTNLKGMETESGIKLVWDMPDTTSSSNTTGYYVFRKMGNDVSYVLVSTIPGAYNKTYDDIYVAPNATYSYYVQSYYQYMTSNPSNIITITAPDIPKPVLAFDAIQHTKNIVELRWQSDFSQYIESTKLYKWVVNQTSGYNLIGEFGIDQFEYIDTDIIPGTKTIYKVQHTTDLGESNPKYDFINAPYRDLSQGSPVYIKQLKFTDWKLEGWLAGRPEFYIKVTNVDQGGKNPYTVQDQVECRYDIRDEESQIFEGKMVLNWRPGFWYDMLTFTAIEYDRPSGELKINIGVKFNTKDSLKIGFLEGNAGVNYEVKFSNNGEKCGTAYLDYFDNPEQWLEFPNYGFKILLSESDN